MKKTQVKNIISLKIEHHINDGGDTVVDKQHEEHSNDRELGVVGTSKSVKSGSLE